MSLDNFRNRAIIWDTVNKDFPQPIQVMQGDVNARTLLIKVLDNGAEVDLTGHTLKLTYQYTDDSNSGFIMIPPNDLAKGEFILVIPTEMTKTGVIVANLILLNENLEQVIVSKSLTFISDNSTVTDLAQEVNNKIDDFTKLLLENMPQVMRSELNDLHAQTDSNTSNIELKANLADMTSLQNAMTNLQNEIEAFGITPENLVTIKSLLDAIASNASESQVVELINSVNVLTSNISLMSNGDYSPKANQTDLESLQSAVNNQSATISTKANQTDLNNLQTTVNQAENDAQTAIANAAAAQANSLPLNGNAVSASKLVTARRLGVNLQSSTYVNFDGTADATNIGVAGTLPIANGGNGNAYGLSTSISYLSGITSLLSIVVPTPFSTNQLIQWTTIVGNYTTNTPVSGHTFTGIIFTQYTSGGQGRLDYLMKDQVSGSWYEGTGTTVAYSTTNNITTITAQSLSWKRIIDINDFPVGTIRQTTTASAPTIGGTWTQIGTQVIGSKTTYYWERTA